MKTEPQEGNGDLGSFDALGQIDDAVHGVRPVSRARDLMSVTLPSRTFSYHARLRATAFIKAGLGCRTGRVECGGTTR